MTRPRLIVCGGRDFTDRDLVFRTLAAGLPVIRPGGLTTITKEETNA